MTEFDLIERNKICEKVTDLYRYSKGDMHIAYRELLDYILDMPAADVQPVKRGRWIETHISLCKWIPEDEKEEGYSFYMAEMKCSCCERYNTRTFSLTLKKPDFCQHCGARMDGEQNDINDK